MKLLNLRKRAKRFKNEALELREKMEENPHYNIYVGDQRYKTDFWLRFLKHVSNNAFKKAMIRRFTKTFKCKYIVLPNISSSSSRCNQNGNVNLRVHPNGSELLELFASVVLRVVLCDSVSEKKW